MIVTNTFVFLHLHKSGGTFLNQLLLKCEPSALRLGYHLPYSQLPEAYRHLPVVGTVRNPWDYYVSWYHFQKSQTRPNALFQVCSDDGRLDFHDTITNLVRLSEDEARVADLRQRLPETFQQHGLNLTRDCIGRILGSGQGFYTFLHNRLYEGAGALRILKMETMRDGFKAFVGNDLGLYFLDAAPAMNTSVRGAYQGYYDMDIRALVAHRDAHVIERYGYSF